MAGLQIQQTETRPYFCKRATRSRFLEKQGSSNKRIHLRVVSHLVMRCVGLFRHIIYQGGTRLGCSCVNGDWLTGFWKSSQVPIDRQDFWPQSWHATLWWVFPPGWHCIAEICRSKKSHCCYLDITMYFSQLPRVNVALPTDINVVCAIVALWTLTNCQSLSFRITASLERQMHHSCLYCEK